MALEKKIETKDGKKLTADKFHAYCEDKKAVAIVKDDLYYRRSSKEKYELVKKNFRKK